MNIGHARSLAPLSLHMFFLFRRQLVKEGLALDGSYFSKGKYLHLEPEGARQRLGRYGLKQRWK